MRKIYASIVALFGLIGAGWAQNPGLVISEFLQNPAGTDSPLEYVELLATDDIDFTITPYTVIVLNNGTATTDGWVEGNSISYAFEITTGTVSVGDVVYVGGTGMAPTGTVLRAIDTGVDGGDGGIGNSSSGGVFGNGGGNGDGIGVFNLPVGSITSSTAPVDAVFYGSGLGGAVVGGGADGYETPVNDLYDGGKLQAADFVALDANLTVATGTFDLGTESFSIARTFASSADGTDGVSEIALLEATPPTVGFVVEDLTVAENAGTVALEVELIESNGTASSADIRVVSVSSATNGDDYVLLDTTIAFSGTADEIMSFSFEIEDDMVVEQSEYIVMTMENLVNAELDGNTEMILYITDNDRLLPTTTNELKLDLITSFSTGTEGESSAEIVAFDATQNYLFVANSEANQVDIIDINVVETPVLIDSIEFDSIGGINSVAIYNDVLAVAVEAPIKQDPGFISFWNVDGTFLKRLTVGALPDMITFNHEGTQLVAACEGEPDDDYLIDPKGGVSIIEIDGAIEDLTAADVTNLDFTAFDAMEAELVEAGVRIFGFGALVSEDLEPEYVTILNNDETAYVVLQENNALAVVDLIEKEILDVLPLGTIDHSMLGYGLDASNRTSGINIANFPIHGMFQPDAIHNIEIGGETYLLTANEGDARDYDGYSEEVRVDDLILDETAYPNAEFLQHNHLLGRLKTTTATGDIDGDGDIDQIHSYGTRSFTIWNAEGEMVFDSGDMIEQIIANDPVYVEVFNAHNEDGEIETKDRSDDKGPEPEGIVGVMIDGNAYLFVSLERVGGAMVFNINDPANPAYIGYHNNRDAETNGPDRGAEGMIYVEAEISPSGEGLLILANEVSSTLSIYEVNSCLSISELEVTTEEDMTAFCEGDSLEIVGTESDDLAYQWAVEGVAIDGATENNYFATDAGYYQLSFVNETEACSGTTDSIMIDVNELPLVEAFASEDTICFEEEVILTSEGAETMAWETDGVEEGVAFIPAETGVTEYTVVGTDENGCSNTATVEVLMAEEIAIDVTTTDELTGGDASIDITVSGGIGAYVFDWDNDEVEDFDDEEDLTDIEAGTYIIVVEDEFGCAATETVVVNSQVGLIEGELIAGIYPNPATTQIVLQLGTNELAQVAILNVAGQVVYTNKAVGQLQKIDVSDLTTGVYFVQVSIEGKTSSKKLIVK